MGKDTDAVSAMDIDDQKSNSSDPANPKFSINVLQLLKSAQMQHGLRHGDYTRYRKYCTARLRRLYKSLKFTHGRGRYSRRVITENSVSDVRYLHILLYTAERAWSHAMEKRQLPDGPNRSQRIYLLGRLRKAVKWASLFAQLCAVKGDSRTSLEAEAYASYMKGTLLFEQDQNWDTALRNFKSARAVYEELGKYGDLENQVVCRERVEELEPSIRYCLHKISKSNVQASELLQIGEMEGPALDLFKSKLEAVMAEARSQQAASLTEFQWLGHKFPISNAKTRSYSLAGERAKAYLLFTRSFSLADIAVKELKGMANLDQEMMEELSVLSRSCRSSICIEHAIGIMEKKELEDPEKLSKKISDMSLTCSSKKEKLLIEKLDVYEPAIGASNTKAAPSIEAFPPAYQAVPRNPIVLDLAYNMIEFPSLENRMKKDKKGFISRFWR
ncbi:hypothetical protein V2J09_001449 [Rumex salicifolius]